VEEATHLVSIYFGSLTGRSEPVPAAADRPGPVFPKGESFEFKIDTAIDRGMVVVAYPTDDFWDIGRTRRLSILSEILSERLRVQVREKLGAAYSPYAYHRAYRAYDDYGMLLCMLLVDPQRVDAIAERVEQIGSDLAAQGINSDELRRALDPTLVQIKDMRQSNRYWLNSVLIGASRHPEQIDWARTIERDYTAITAAEITSLARRYVIDSQAARVVIVPAKSQ
jgi:zinc protease